LGGVSNEAGTALMSSNKVSISHNNLAHHIEVTTNQTNISDVNNLVFSHNADGIRINDFTDTKQVTIVWDS
jgi:hypothetical protein